MSSFRLAVALILAATLASCARRPTSVALAPVPRPSATEGAPEVRAFGIATPMSDSAADALFARLGAAGFNTLYIETPAPPDEGQDAPFTPHIGSLAHRHGLDVLLRIFPACPPEAPDSVAAAMDRAAQWLKPQIDAGLVDGIIIDTPVDSPPVSPEQVFAPFASFEATRLGAIFYPTAATAASDERLAAAGAWSAERVAWARQHRVERLVAYPHFGTFDENLAAADRVAPPHCPTLVLLNAEARSDASPDAAVQLNSQIESTRRHPMEGVVVAAEPTDALLGALREGPFAEPAFPPSRDWRIAFDRCVAQAASAEDKPELIAGGLASLRRAMDAQSASDMQAHRVIDMLLGVSPEPTQCRRDLELAIVCLRAAQRQEMPALNR